MKHTPGPWIIEANGPAFNLSQEGMPHHMILVGMVSNAVGEHLANSNLIAAAPDLLEACNGFISVLKGFNGLLEIHAKDDEIVGALDALLDQYGAIAEAAIAKATE